MNKPKDIQKCEKCDEAGSLLYFCEFCRNNFCIKCTREEAHGEGYAKNNNIIDCMQIHKEKLNEENCSKDEESEMIIDDYKLADIANCDCGKANKEENFECFNCGKVFCETCPNRPVEDNCLECLIAESKPRSSTPIRIE